MTAKRRRILEAVRELGPSEAYGLPLYDALGGKLSLGEIYSTLVIARYDGLVTDQHRSPCQERSWRNRSYWMLTDAGHRALAESHELAAADVALALGER